MNEIKPTYVTFEQAKRINNRISNQNKIYYLDKEGNEITDEFIINKYTSKNLKVPVVDDAKSAFADTYMSKPEQWQVVEWASLFHNIDIEARPVRYAGDIKTSYYQPYINGSIVSMSKFETRPKALSEAINEFLKMI
jgi:hypothetical protein